MIPTMILFGLVLGRWPRLTLLLAALVWPVLLLVSGVASSTPWPTVVLGGAVFGAINAFVGIAVHQGVLWVVRCLLARRGRVREES